MIDASKVLREMKTGRDSLKPKDILEFNRLKGMDSDIWVALQERIRRVATAVMEFNEGLELLRALREKVGDSEAKDVEPELPDSLTRRIRWFLNEEPMPMKGHVWNRRPSRDERMTMLERHLSEQWERLEAEPHVTLTERAAATSEGIGN